MLIKKSSSVSEPVSMLSVPDAARLKAELVRQMAIIIEEKSLTRRVIAELLGFNQPQVSMMLRGQVKSYTVEQLADFLSILNGRSPQEQPSQNQVVVVPAPAKQNAVVPQIAMSDAPVSVPTGQIELNESLAGVMEEIAYLRQHLALVGRSDSPQERLRQRKVMQAEVELLRRENALLREKTERFERMTELLQLA
jgi:predicted XRE-type DNA-binding protein